MRVRRHLPAALLMLSAAMSLAQDNAAPSAPTQDATARSASSSEMMPGTRFFSLEHRSHSQMSASDAQALEQRSAEIASEAAFYGYDLKAGIWTYEQVMCPEIPGQLLLQYSSAQADGRESRFNALVPRGSGRVKVVPVVFRGGAPFGAPVSNPRNFRIFNAAVSADVARQSIDENGHWLSLAACYVELTAGHSHIPTEPTQTLEFVQAPDPTLSVQPSFSEVIFSDRTSQENYVVWSVKFSKDGRVAGADVANREVAKGKIVAPIEPSIKMVTADSPMKTRTVPDSSGMRETPGPGSASGAVVTPSENVPTTMANTGSAAAPSSSAMISPQPAPQDPTAEMVGIPGDRKVKVVNNPSYPQLKVKLQPGDPQGKVVTPPDSQAPQN